MDLQTLQTNVNYRRRDTTESFISNDEVKEYLNEGLRKINSDGNWEFLKTSAAFSYVDGSMEYALSAVASDNKFPINIFYTKDYEFGIISPEDFRKVSASGLNVFATDNQDLLVKTSFGSATLGYHYYSTHMAKTSGGTWQASLSAATDEPLIPVRWRDMLVDFAAARCYQKEEQIDDFTIAYADFRRELDKMRMEYPSKRRRILTRIKHSSEVGVRAGGEAIKGNPLGA